MLPSILLPQLNVYLPYLNRYTIKGATEWKLWWNRDWSRGISFWWETNTHWNRLLWCRRIQGQAWITSHLTDVKGIQLTLSYHTAFSKQQKPTTNWPPTYQPFQWKTWSLWWKLYLNLILQNTDHWPKQWRSTERHTSWVSLFKNKVSKVKIHKIWKGCVGWLETMSTKQDMVATDELVHLTRRKLSMMR